jgi:hypothetical protein
VEEVMNKMQFHSSVFVQDGQFTIQEIECIRDALDFMERWPEARRGTIYETAKRACHAAHEGWYPIDAARRAFMGWTRSAKILEDTLTVSPWLNTPQTGSRGLPS